MTDVHCIVLHTREGSVFVSNGVAVCFCAYKVRLHTDTCVILNDITLIIQRCPSNSVILLVNLINSDLHYFLTPSNNYPLPPKILFIIFLLYAHRQTLSPWNLFL